MSQRGSVERILDAVVKLVATYGPDTTTVRNVAAEAEVSVGAVQHHYRTKEELLVAAMTAAGDEFRQLAVERTGAVQGRDRPKPPGAARRAAAAGRADAARRPQRRLSRLWHRLRRRGRSAGAVRRHSGCACRGRSAAHRFRAGTAPGGAGNTSV